MEGVDVSKADLSKYDIAHFTRFNPYRISVLFSKPEGVKFILTIYDLIPLIYPKHYPPGIRGWVNWQINKILIRKNIDAIITISETSKKDICRFLGVNSKKVHVIYLAPRLIFKKLKIDNSLEIGNWKLEIAKRYKLPEHFALYVGDINYNKNIPTLVKACKIAKIPLVVAGKQALEIDKMDLNHPELIHLNKVDWSGTTRLGFVSDEDLVKIYNLAEVYIQPSLYEGFGLPVLEANSAGVPVVCSRTQALVEISENAALFAESGSADDFADKINLLISDSKFRNQLITKGLENAKKFSWQKTAEETLKVYQNI
jgi:glycosyltransferase involved in cell wall biosynthesis